MIIIIAVDTGVDISLVQYIFSLMYRTWYGYSFTCKLTLCSNHLLTMPGEGAFSRPLIWPLLDDLTSPHCLTLSTSTQELHQCSSPLQGTTIQWCIWRKFHCKHSPCSKVLSSVNVNPKSCRRQPKIFSPASYGIAHNCVSNSGTWLPSLNKSWINQAEAFIQPLKWKWIPFNC